VNACESSDSQAPQGRDRGPAAGETDRSHADTLLTAGRSEASSGVASQTLGVPAAVGRLLATLNPDGTRLWLRPTLARGRFWRARRAVGWALIAIYLALPHIAVGGQPALRFDLARGEFHFFGATLFATDTALLMLFAIAALLAVFWVTALYGRLWCGWGCPQTVYLELLFRPLERWIEGGARQQEALDRSRWPWRRWLKWGAFAAISFLLANNLLAYFVPSATLWAWVTGSPLDHPHGFAVVVGVFALMLIDFGWFREQMCTVVCPYARLQSVLVDRETRVVGYDLARGEPRGKLRKTSDLSLARSGDCVDCKACAHTCPTGVDIRDGSQLECVGCMQCVDACDAVMVKIGKPTGLVRWDTQPALQGGDRPAGRRWRTILYPSAMVVVLAALAWAAIVRSTADVTLLRGIGAPFDLVAGGAVVNQVRVRVHNHSGAPRSYTVAIDGAADLRLVAPENPFAVSDGDTRTLGVFIEAPPAAIAGKRDVRVRVSDGATYDEFHPFRLIGPR